MLSDAVLQNQIKKLFADKLDVDVPSYDTDLIENQVMDSLRFVELLMHLEGHFGMSIGVEDLEIADFRTVATIAKAVGRRLQVKNAA